MSTGTRLTLLAALLLVCAGAFWAGHTTATTRLTVAALRAEVREAIRFDSVQRIEAERLWALRTTADTLSARAAIQGDSLRVLLARYQQARRPATGTPSPIVLTGNCDEIVSSCDRYRLTMDSVLASKDILIAALTTRLRGDSAALAQCRIGRAVDQSRADIAQRSGSTRRAWTTAGVAVGGMVLGGWTMRAACR